MEAKKLGFPKSPTIPLLYSEYILFMGTIAKHCMCHCVRQRNKSSILIKTPNYRTSNCWGGDDKVGIGLVVPVVFAVVRTERWQRWHRVRWFVFNIFLVYCFRGVLIHLITVIVTSNHMKSQKASVVYHIIRSAGLFP